MYVGFFLNGDYDLVSYSFHRLESSILFIAYSITISDWANVLYDLQEYPMISFLMRKYVLIILNTVNLLISLINFSICYVASDFNSYTSSSVYIIGIFIQIFMSFSLTCFMLSAGLKLRWRIQGAAGKLDKKANNAYFKAFPTAKHPIPAYRKHRLSQNPYENYDEETDSEDHEGHTAAESSLTSQNNSLRNKPNSLVVPYPSHKESITNSQTRNTLTGNNEPFLHSQTPQETPENENSNTHVATENRVSENSLEFRNALRNLIVVMATCSLCILFQVLRPLQYE